MIVLTQELRESMRAAQLAPPDGSSGWANTQSGILARINYERGVEAGFRAALMGLLTRPELECLNYDLGGPMDEFGWPPADGSVTVEIRDSYRRKLAALTGLVE